MSKVGVQLPPNPTELPTFTSVSWKPLHNTLYRKVFSLLFEKGLFFNNKSARSTTPYDLKTSSELRNLIDFRLGQNGTDSDTLFSYLENIIKYSARRSHPFYLGKYSTGLDPYAFAADIIGSANSTTVITFLGGPVYTLMEEEFKTKLMSVVGYSNGHGIIVPGGGFANLMALRLAIQKNYPELRNKGYGGTGEPKICIFVSEHGNNSIEKAAIITGLGSTACVTIPVDTNGRMDIGALKIAVRNSKIAQVAPLMVVATLGTMYTGAIDPVHEIAQFCTQEDIWLHVDGDYAGPYVFSETLKKQKLRGIENSKSFCLGMEGIFGSPYCSTVLITSYPNLLMDTFGLSAEYVFHPTLLYDMKYDNGDLTIQTSRRGDILKSWLMWKVKGRNGLAKQVEYVDAISRNFSKEISKRPAFHLIVPKNDSTRIGFYYIPRQLRPLLRSTDYSNPIMKNFSPQVKKKLIKAGLLYIGLEIFPGVPEYFMVSVTNSALTLNDLNYVLDTIEDFGMQHESESVGNTSGIITPQIPVNAAILEKTSVIPDPPRSYPTFVTSPIEAQHKLFFIKLFDMIQDKALYYQERRSEAPLNFRPPEILQKEFNFELHDEPMLKNEDDVVKTLEQVIFYNVRQAHPFYIYQLLSGGLDAYGIMADFVSAAMTSEMIGFEDSPVYSLMEDEVFRAVRERIGYPAEGDGLLCPGGSISNITAIYVARYFKFPDSKDSGLEEQRNNRLTYFISKNAHYCFNKGALVLGLGLDNCIHVDVDSDGRMDPNALRTAIRTSIAGGATPFMVVATSGTTILGVCDPLPAIADICQEFGLWFHIDGSVGGAVMMSDKELNSKLKGIELSDSMGFNAHKWFGVPLEASILVFRHRGVVAQALGVRPLPYKSEIVPQIRNTMQIGYQSGIQWSRRPNIAKFWFLWKAQGIKGMGQHIDYTLRLKDFMVAELKRPKRAVMFRLWKQNFENAGVCFHYLPEILRGLDETTDEFKTRLNNVGLPLTDRLVRAGIMTIGVFKDGDSPYFMKFILMSSGVTENDIRYLLNQIDNFGYDLLV